MAAPTFSLAGNAKGPGRKGTPFLFFKSTQNNPAVRTITITSNYPFLYNFYDVRGVFLKSAYIVPPVATSPFTVVADFTNGFPNLTLPTYMNVSIVDTASNLEANNVRIQVLGGDVFNVQVTYGDIASGNQMISVDGAHIPVNPTQWEKIFEKSSDTHLGGNGQ